ncbi:MAG TPA: site-2 protease family protein [Patescibacteria group bacterium]|nr:site-2 protease family protein [Patescibacteria group bacterium]
MDVVLHKFLYTLGFALATALVFIFHEVGHYITAVLCRVQVESVTVGVGREIWARTGSGGTRWSVRMFPICGSVQLYPHEGEHMTPEHRARAFVNQKLWKRFLIVSAGPAANIILALFAIMMFYTFAGKPESPLLISGVSIGMPADKAGMQPGDRIVMLDGKPVSTFEDLHVGLTERDIHPVSLRYERDGKSYDIMISPVWVKYTDEKGFDRAFGRIGVLNSHIPLWLTYVWSVDGVDTKGKPGKARELLKSVLDKTSIVGIESDDGNIERYRVHIPAETNKGLSDPDAKENNYDWVFFDNLTDNVFLIYDPYTSLKMAVRETSRLVSGLLTQVVGRTTHIDRALFVPETSVRPVDYPVKSALFRFFQTMATLSVVIALVNLMPLPWFGFDGSFLVVYIYELFAGAERARASTLHVQRLAALIFVSIWLVVNLHVVSALLRLG